MVIFKTLVYTRPDFNFCFILCTGTEWIYDSQPGFTAWWNTNCDLSFGTIGMVSCTPPNSSSSIVNCSNQCFHQTNFTCAQYTYYNFISSCCMFQYLPNTQNIPNAPFSFPASSGLSCGFIVNSTGKVVYL